MSDRSVAAVELEPIRIDSVFSQEHLEAMWAEFEAHLNPFIYVLCINGDLFRMLDAGAKRFIAMKFMCLIREDTIYVRDGNGPDRYFLGAPRHFVSGTGVVLNPTGTECIWLIRPGVPAPAPVMLVAEGLNSVHQGPGSEVLALPSSEEAAPADPVEGTPEEKPVKIRRPPNAYILYRKERHSMVKERNPTITNNQISQILGSAWNMETREVRSKYKEMADKVKQALLAKHPNYQYRPRRPTERRRRARRNPQQALAQAQVVADQPMSSPDSNASAVDAA